MHFGGRTQQRRRVTLPLAMALMALAIGCSEDPPTGGTGGSGGSGGSTTGGTAGAGGSGTSGAGGSAGSGGTTGTGGAAGSGGAAGGKAGSGGASGGGTAGSGGASGGKAGSGGASGGGTAGSAGATGGTAGSAGATGGTAGSAGATGGTAGSSGAAGSSGSAGADGGTSDGGMPDPTMNFFVTSDTSKTGNLGGLSGADARCQRLATAVGFGSKTWRAYLSAEALDGGAAVNAKDRIGPGPYYNAKGAMLAANSTALHARNGDAELFITEKGAKVNGQWAGSPTPNEHDILTGTNPDGTVTTGQTCVNWTSEAMTNTAQIGHSDGLGPSMNPAPPYNSWNSSHANGGCHDTLPKGGAGRIYCFTAP